MAIARVEAVATATVSAGTAVATIASTASGELIIVQWSGNGDTPTLSDNQGQSYTTVFNTGDIAGHFSGLSYKENSAAGVTTVTLTTTGGGTLGGIHVAHYTGALTSGALDQNGGTPGLDAGDAWTSALVTTTQADELLIGANRGHFNGANANFVASGSWTEIAQMALSVPFDGNNGGSMQLQEQIVSSIQTNIANTGTNGGTALVNNYPGIATFKASGGGGSDLSVGVGALGEPVVGGSTF